MNESLHKNVFYQNSKLFLRSIFLINKKNIDFFTKKANAYIKIFV